MKGHFSLFYGKLSNTLGNYSVNKAVWLTETGYSTYSDNTDSDLFYTSVLPQVYRKLGINTSNSTIAILASPNPKTLLPNQDNLNICYGFKKCQSIEIADLKLLDKYKCPVLMVLYGEKFPMNYFEDLRAYVGKGGTVVFPEGGAVLYYDWNTDNNEIKGVGEKYYDKLHINYLFPWDDVAKKKGLKSKLLSVNTKTQDGINYEWDQTELTGPKYLTGDNLKENDVIIPIIEGTDGIYKGNVAACYKLNSNLKGNIIIQTRSNNTHRISERLQATRCPRLFLLSFASGVEKVFYYCLRDRSKSGSYGIIRNDYTEKPVFQTLKTLTEKCPSGSSRPIIIQREHQYIASWETPNGKKIYCVWSDIIGSSNTIRVKGCAKYYNENGKKINGNKFNLSPSIVYIEGAKDVYFEGE